MKKNRSFDELLMAHLDGETTPEDPRALSNSLSDPSTRRQVQALEELQSLIEELRDEALEPPAHLTERTMRRIARQPPPIIPVWRRLTEALMVSPWRLATAGGALVAVGLILGLTVDRLASPSHRDASPGAAAHLDQLALPFGEVEAPPAEPSKDRHVPVRVHFVLRAPEAERVSVVGDFNGWNPHASQLELVGSVWRAVISLPPGRYEYQFVVDGDIWLVDPSAHGTVDDGFGGVNGVLEV